MLFSPLRFREEMEGLSSVCQNPRCAKKAMFWFESR